MALVIPLDVSASPQTVPLGVETPVEQTVNGDYEQLVNLPQINGVTLIGDKSAADLGLVDADDYDPVDKTAAMTQPVGKGADGKLYTTPAPSEDVFIAEYGVTTYAEITAARNAGRACFMREDEAGLVALYSEIGMGPSPSGDEMDSAYIFTATAGGRVYSYWCWFTGGWSDTSDPIGTYSKPYGGIPKSDLASDVRTSLGKADTALQAVPNTYRTAADQNLIDLAQDDAIRDAGTRIGDIEALIPAAASVNNKLADKAFVNSSVQTNTAHFRGNWATWADVPTNAADYPADDDGNTTPTTNDYMVIQDAADYPVAAGEDALSGTWRFKYTGLWVANGRAGWRPEYQVNETPLTAAQLAALNSGATAEIISSVADKLNKTGDGSDVTTAFSIASTRANISTGEKLSVIFGKIAKWFSDLGSAAFRAATNAVTQDSTDLVESGAVYTGLAGKYEKPSPGIPKSDLAQALQTSLDKADSYGSVYVTPEMFGAVGDGATDDAAAFEAALATGLTLLLPAKTYYLSRALVLSDDSSAYVTVNIVGSGKTESKLHLAGSFTTNKLGESIISDIGFYTEAADSNTAYVFPAALRNTRVSGCEFYRFDKIFYRLEQCCIITKNWFRNLYTTLCTQCVDAFITDNYLSGAGVKNPQTVLFPESLSSTTISNNFISNCYKVFAVSGTMSNVTITGNIFAVCYCIFYNHVGGVTFTGNTIKWLKKQSSWDVSENSDMNTKPWAVIKRALDNSVSTWWVESVIAGNTIDGDYDLYMDCGTGYDLTRYPTYNFTIDDVVPASKIVFSCAKSAVAGDMENVMIRPMLKRTVQVLPSAALTGSPIVSFDRDEVICDGVLYLNNGGTWVTTSNVQTDWNAASGAAVLLNKPTIPTTPADIGAAAADLNITNASVGQVVTIGAVDGNGKPTAFSSATLLSAAGVSF